MPILKSAIKKLKQDKKRTKVNKPYREKYRLAVKTARIHPSLKTLKLAAAALDKAAKKKVIHKNKANRLKSRLTRLLKKTKKK
ncbi:MAG: 30S ribosomal protein S20 [Candidatus Beckwithbacteria bacterium]|nr:30S ribosomal protein S20 [Candidatus Beckwithbacteria bacterium]